MRNKDEKNDVVDCTDEFRRSLEAPVLLKRGSPIMVQVRFKNMIIHLRLSNDPYKRRFIHKSTKESNQRSLSFQDAWIIYGSLRVGDQEIIFSGAATICEGKPSENEFATFSCIREYECDGETNPTCFVARVNISADTFNYLLDLNDEQTIICLTLEFDNFDGNIKWVPYGGDGEMYWDISKKTHTDCFFEISEKIEIHTYKEK